MKPHAVMLFAAGIGTRLGDLTRTRPKPLIPVAGRALIDRAVDIAEDAGVGIRVANAHHLADMLVDHLATNRNVLVSREHAEILETGGGLRKALPLLGSGPVYTLNTDCVWSGPNPLSCLADAWDGESMGALLLLAPAARARGHDGPGDFLLDEDGRLRRRHHHP